jgi:hypothetical protein
VWTQPTRPEAPLKKSLLTTKYVSWKYEDELQGSSGSDFDRLSEEVEGTLLAMSDPEPLYYSGADLVFAVNRKLVGG